MSPLEPAHDTGLAAFAELDPPAQALALARSAREARLVRIAWDEAGAAAQGIAARFERALEQALDADDLPAVAPPDLLAALAEVSAAGLRVEPSLSAMAVDGVLGDLQLRVLTAVLAPAPATATG